MTADTTTASPPALTRDEDAIISIIRQTGIGFTDAVEAISKSVIASRARGAEVKRTRPPAGNPDYVGLPAEPGPPASFRVVNSFGQLETIIEGRGLTLERAIAEETQHFHTPGEDDKAGDPYDLTFYRDGLVAAVVRDVNDGRGTFRVLPIGEDWPSRVGSDPGGTTEAEVTPGEEEEAGDEDPVTATPPGAPARELALKVLTWARSDLNAAGLRRAEAVRTHREYFEGNPEDKAGDADLYRWLDSLVSAEGDARGRVAAAVLMIHGKIEECSDLFELPNEGWAPVAFDLANEVIIVRPDEGSSRPAVDLIAADDFDADQF